MKKLSLFVLSLGFVTLFSCGQVSSSSAPEGMELIWSDEFSGDKLDEASWSFDQGGGGWGNNELEYYTKDNAILADGTLSITAKKEMMGNCAYTSSRIKTARKASTTYGRIEARIKLSAQNAMWPAFWMMPEVNNGWPLSGEIDIMENKGSDGHSTSSALHYVNGNGEPDYVAGSHTWSTRYDNTSIEDWHLYYVVWDEESFTFYVDDAVKLTVPKRTWHPENGQTYKTNDDAPFNKDFYVILNLAVGGNFDGGRKPDADFESASMQVDYVRMYAFK